MASKATRMLWERGVRLDDAWLEYAPREMAAEWANLPKFTNAAPQISNSNNAAEFVQSLTRALSNSNRRSTLELEMREALLTDLYNDQLIATGYQQFPSIGRNPVIIDPEKFENGNPNWYRGTFKAHGIEYGRIRVTDHNRPKNPNCAGPPKGSKAAIEMAVKHLQGSDPQFGKNLRQRDCQKVRDYLNTRSIPGNGLSDQNISKAIVRICGSKAIKSKSN